MSHIILQQPDGQWCIWSTVVEDFLIINATREKIIEFKLGRERDRLETKLDDIEEQGGHYYSPPQSVEELLERSEYVEKSQEDDE